MFTGFHLKSFMVNYSTQYFIQYPDILRAVLKSWLAAASFYDPLLGVMFDNFPLLLSAFEFVAAVE